MSLAYDVTYDIMYDSYLLSPLPLYVLPDPHTMST
jgi:hypothetical protein